MFIIAALYHTCASSVERHEASALELRFIVLNIMKSDRQQENGRYKL